MSIIFYSTLFIAGLAAGSFLNVLTLRYRPERSFFSKASFGGRSRCVSCGVTLMWYELIPLVSFMLQGGKCRSCGVRLRRQYPIVEFAAAILAVGIPLFFSTWHGMRGVAALEAPLWYYGFLLLWYAIALVWVSIAIVDMKHYLVPDELNVALAILGVGLVALLAAHQGVLPAFRFSFLKHYALLFTPSFLGGVWISHLAGALVGGLFFWFLSLIERGAAMGFGDVKLALASGFILGFPDIAFATLVAFVIGGVWGAILMLTGKKKIGDKLPFAPFLVAGFFLTIVFSFPLLSSYFRLLNF
ncbi:MAG: prepilin peptidase [Candidatus Jorgensenbacteria bacterium]|nr:prepilin peptidase [Candidatus Jorgensenbacteria bacterium]